MSKARLAKECSVSASNEVGSGAKVAEAVSKAGLNVLGFCGYGEGDKAHFLFVTEDSDKASAALKGAGITCECSDVILVEASNKPGAVAEVLRSLADAGVDAEYCYATAQGSDALCVIKTPDATKALSALK